MTQTPQTNFRSIYPCRLHAEIALIMIGFIKMFYSIRFIGETPRTKVAREPGFSYLIMLQMPLMIVRLNYKVLLAYIASSINVKDDLLIHVIAGHLKMDHPLYHSRAFVLNRV